MGKSLAILIALASLAGCANQLDVGKTDASIALFEVDGQTGLIGASSIQADGCMLVVRNLPLIDKAETSLENIRMKTADCEFGGKEEIVRD